MSETDCCRGRREQLASPARDELLDAGSRKAAFPKQRLGRLNHPFPAPRLMRGHGAGCLPVVENGRLVGIVTVSDLMELIGRGSERPVASATRWVLRDRGRRPHAQTAAKSTHGPQRDVRR